MVTIGVDETYEGVVIKIHLDDGGVTTVVFSPELAKTYASLLNIAANSILVVRQNAN